MRLSLRDAHDFLRLLSAMNQLAYLALFAAAFGSATLLPMQSEAVLLGLLSTGAYAAVVLIFVATLGNVLGSMLNWWLGSAIVRFKERAWFPISADKLSRAQKTYSRYGYWSLLLSWVPVIGDPITLIAGVMKEPLWRFIGIVTIAKLGRYVILVLIFNGLL